MRSAYLIQTITNAGGTYNFDTARDLYPITIFNGTATLLVSGYTIAPLTPTPTTKTHIRIFYDGHITYSGGNVVTVFGTQLSAEQALKGKCLIDIIYDYITASWLVAITEGFDTNYEGLEVTNLNAGGQTITLTSNSKQVQYLTSAAVLLTGNISVTSSGAFRDGQTFFIKYAGLFTIGTSSVSLMGVGLTAQQVAGGNCTLIAWYDLANAVFRTQLIASAAAASGFAYNTLPVALAGTLYPPAQAGDAFRITCVSEEGRLGNAGGNLEPPLIRRVYNDDLMYCITNTSGGDTAAAGASFFIIGAPRAFTPFTNVNGNNNYQLNTSKHITSANTLSGASEGNVLVAEGTNVSGASVFNFIVGFAHSIVQGLRNLIYGRQITVATGSDSNVAGGYLNTVNGNNNAVSGQGHSVIGSDSLVTGSGNALAGASAGVSMRNVMGGAGGEAKITNALVLGATTSPNTLSGVGSAQASVIPLVGRATDILHPSINTMVLSTNFFNGGQDVIALLTNGMAMSMEGRFIVFQKAVGVNHTNTSAIGDYVEFHFSAVIKRSIAGALTLVDPKWLDHRNRWTPTTSPSPVNYRSRVVANGVQADVCLIRPVIGFNGNNLEIEVFFPGFATVMNDNGALTTPRFSWFAATGDVPLPVINTGIAADDGVVKNTITTALAPLIAPTFRNPLVDIFDGSDANGSGYFDGSGFGAVATSQTTTTGIVDIGLYNGGSYNNIVATVTFDFGNAAATCNMSAQSDHIGNNVGFTAGNYAGVPNGNYAFTFSGGTGTGASGYATITGGVVIGTTMSSGGTGYTTGDVVTITIPTALPVTTPAVFTPTLYWSVLSVTIGTPGNLYRNDSNLAVTFAGAGFSQATGTASIVPVPITTSGGLTGSITVTKGGKGYGLCRPNVAVYDGGGLDYEEGNGGSFVSAGIVTVAQIKYG